MFNTIKLFVTSLLKGDSFARYLMNMSFRGVSLKGRVLDVGGGRKPDYYKYFDCSSASEIIALDGTLQKINFEIDQIPYEDNVFDTVVACNILEHIHNYAFLVNQISRTLRPKGVLVGFVPFLVQFHPDPEDHFRYTETALRRILENSQFAHVQIVPIGMGPIGVIINSCMFWIPKWVRPLFVGILVLFAKATVMYKPALVPRYPLGYFFTGIKKHA